MLLLPDAINLWSSIVLNATTIALKADYFHLPIEPFGMSRRQTVEPRPKGFAD